MVKRWDWWTVSKRRALKSVHRHLSQAARPNTQRMEPNRKNTRANQQYMRRGKTKAKGKGG